MGDHTIARLFNGKPWKWEANPTSRNVTLSDHRGDYMVVTFRRYGMQDAQPEFWTWCGADGNPTTAAKAAEPVPGREHHADWHKSVEHPMARVIAQVPVMYAALEAINSAEPGAETLAYDAWQKVRRELDLDIPYTPHDLG